MSKPTTVNCPTCNTTVEWSSASRYRPFCSERCKLIDLGEWVSENHRIPGQPLPPGSHHERESDQHH